MDGLWSDSIVIWTKKTMTLKLVEKAVARETRKPTQAQKRKFSRPLQHYSSSTLDYCLHRHYRLSFFRPVVKINEFIYMKRNWRAPAIRTPGGQPFNISWCLWDGENNCGRSKHLPLRDCCSFSLSIISSLSLWFPSGDMLEVLASSKILVSSKDSRVFLSIQVHAFGHRSTEKCAPLHL